MSERTYRFVLGLSLIVVLYFHWEPLEYVYVSVLLFEGLTGFRITVMLARMRTGDGAVASSPPPRANYRFNFDAERGMRLWFGGFMAATFLALPADFWFVNWIIAISLFLSGLVNYCPMVGTLRWLGFR
jgi:hypothetical protein